MTTFKKVKNSNDIDTVAQLAHEIWNQHFTSIIGKAQVDYMLDKFQLQNACRCRHPYIALLTIINNNYC